MKLTSVLLGRVSETDLCSAGRMSETDSCLQTITRTDIKQAMQAENHKDCSNVNAGDLNFLIRAGNFF